MKEETIRWFKKAGDDLRKANDNFNIKNYDLSAFLCQQAVEKALKALLIEKSGKFPKVHDLVNLGKLAKIPTELIDETKELTLAYTYSRYPDIKEELNLKEKSINFLKTAKRILEWIKKQL